MKVIILSGCSGSGKTTYGSRLMADLGGEFGARIVSADDYFMQDGKYRFDVSKLTEAHGYCLRRFVEAILAPGPRTPTIIVDNTNTTTEEIAPYHALAQAYGYEVELHNFFIDPAIAAERNSHGVPLAACAAMQDRIKKRKLPPFWKMTILYHSTQSPSV